MSDEISYLDFEMTVEQAGKDNYLIRAESGDQSAQAAFVNPFNEDQQTVVNSTLTAAGLRRTARVRSSSAPEVGKMKAFGTVLFEHTVTGPVRDFYDKCRSQADNECKGIRWRLALDPSVDDLPWEFLCLRDRFLALDPRNPIVRYIKPDTWIAPLESEHPLRLLLVVASPSDEVPLDTELEKERILAALKPLIDKGQVHVSIIEGPNTWEQLINKLLRDQTHILHFIGHGAFDKQKGEGVLVMEDIDGRNLTPSLHNVKNEDYFLLLTSGVRTCSARKPMPIRRAGMRRSTGQRLKSFSGQGNFNCCLLPSTRPMT